MKSFLNLIKIKHWIKNFFIFTPLIFSLQLFNTKSLFQSIVSFFNFSFVAVFVYIINDIKDKKTDSQHPAKSQRPIASGKISIPVAVCTGAFFFAAGIYCALLFNPKTVFILVSYFIINIFYTFFLKEIVILDVFIIATGFCLRVLLGSMAIGVELSHWMLLTTFSVSLVLGFGKRRHELVLLGKNAFHHRNILGEYNKEILNIMIIISTAITAIDPASIVYNA